MKFRNSTIPILSVLTVIAVAGGFQLGETAIAQIDPLYFEGAAVPARDVTRSAPAQRRNDYAAASGWEEGYADREADCGANCAPMSSDQAMARLDAPLEPYSDPTIEPRWERAAAPARDDVLVAPRDEPVGAERTSRVDRYLHYPVSSDQAEIRAAQEARRELAAERTQRR